MNLPASKLIKNQKITKTRTLGNERLTVTIRHDDECGNGHNTFAITGDLAHLRRGVWLEDSFGMLHDEVTRFFPDLAPLLKWHLCSTDGPMHYVANSIYHARAIPKEQGQWYFYLEDNLIKIVNREEREKFIARYGTWAEFKPYYNTMAKDPDLAAARSCAIWPEAELADFTEENLLVRLPALMEEFKTAVESLGLVY